MKKQIVHYELGLEKETGEPVLLCGQWILDGDYTTEEKSNITCKACLREINRLEKND